MKLGYKLKLFTRVGVGLGSAIALLASGCLSSNEQVDFLNTNLKILTASTSTSKSWIGPMIVDLGAVDVSSSNLAKHQNIDLAASSATYPMALTDDSAGNYFLFFNRGNTVPPMVPTATYGYAIQASPIGSTDWVNSSYSVFTQFAGAIADDVQKPMALKDSAGNLLSLFIGRRTADSVRAPIASVRVKGSGYWGSSTDISDTTLATPATDNVTVSVALANDAYNNFVVAYRQRSTAYFNQYRPNLGWRFVTGTTNHFSWEVAADVGLVGDYGMDIGFDSYGNGYGVYVTTANAIKAARWRGNTLKNIDSSVAGDYQTVSTGATSPYGYPKIFVEPGGAATIFFYNNYSAMTGTAELYSAYAGSTSSANPGTFSAPGRFDSTVGGSGYAVLMKDGADLFAPSLAFSGSKAVLGIVKQDSAGVYRFYVFKYEGSGRWTSLGAVDTGGTGNDVSYGSVAINGSGDIAISYSASSASDALEHVYAVTYIGGSWSSIKRVDANTSFTAPAPPARSRPVVLIDSSSNVIVGYSYPDSFFGAPYRRRAVVAVYK